VYKYHSPSTCVFVVVFTVDIISSAPYSSPSSILNKMASLLTGNSFDPNKDIPDLSGKVYVITGGTAGIGFGITAHILQHNPSKIYVLSKKQAHGDEAVKELQEWGDVSKVEYVQCDFEDLKQTDEVAKSLKEKLDRLDAVRSPFPAFVVILTFFHSSFSMLGLESVSTPRQKMASTAICKLMSSRNSILR
jgi:hypothetical protein